MREIQFLSMPWESMGTYLDLYEVVCSCGNRKLYKIAPAHDDTIIMLMDRQLLDCCEDHR